MIGSDEQAKDGISCRSPRRARSDWTLPASARAARDRGRARRTRWARVEPRRCRTLLASARPATPRLPARPTSLPRRQASSVSRRWCCRPSSRTCCPRTARPSTARAWPATCGSRCSPRRSPRSWPSAAASASPTACSATTMRRETRARRRSARRQSRRAGERDGNRPPGPLVAPRGRRRHAALARRAA